MAGSYAGATGVIVSGLFGMSRQASGLRAWLLQRVSAVVIAAGAIIFAIKLMMLPPQNLLEWIVWLNNPLISVLILLWVVAVLLHAWVGIRDIVIDYVHALEYRVLILACCAVSFVSMALWALLIVIKI